MRVVPTAMLARLGAPRRTRRSVEGKSAGTMGSDSRSSGSRRDGEELDLPIHGAGGAGGTMVTLFSKATELRRSSSLAIRGAEQ